jgi:hypothetical protein
MRRALALVAVSIAAFAVPANAAVITFDDLKVPADGFSVIPLWYGDVGELLDVQYRSVNPADGATHDTHLKVWGQHYGDLRNVAFAPHNNFLGELSLVAAPGWEIVLNGFDLGGWMNTDYEGQTVRLLDGAFNTIVDYSPVHIEGDFVGPRHVHFAPGVAGQTIRIQYGPNWNVGLDNIDYSLHQVPEPASLTLVSIGLLGSLFVRRRRT